MGQPRGVLSGRIIFTSGGHGWNWSGSAWTLDRPLLLDMNEDTGNVDQMTMFAYHCFNAGATVVPFRPVGNQTNQVVLDNDDPGVIWSGLWADSSSTVFFGSPGDVAYRFASGAAVESATATYTPNIPAAGFYPVYAWALAGGNRTNQLYRINHTGGQSQVRVPHHMVGGGWVYLGTYYFAVGSHPASGAVVISNETGGPDGVGAIIADAIRFGNGMGDVNPGSGVSTYPREDECSRMWILRGLGQGQSTSPYDNGNVSAPPRMAAEMNREGAGNIYKRVYVGFHSNASSGSARGVTALYNDPNRYPTTVETNSATPNQFRFAQILGTEVQSDMLSLTAPPLEIPWYSRGSGITYASPDFAYGEINNNRSNGEFDSTIVEVAFHDNANDARLLRDPKARNWVARSVVHGLIRYFNEFDGLPLNFPPEPPGNVRAQAAASLGAVTVSWSVPVAQAGSGAPTGYVVYASSDGCGFGNALVLTGGGSTSVTLTNLALDTAH
jgi:hypothetical protein